MAQDERTTLSIQALRTLTEERDRFRTSINGFDKQQVNTYITRICAEYEKTIAEQGEELEKTLVENKALVQRIDAMFNDNDAREAARAEAERAYKEKCDKAVAAKEADIEQEKQKYKTECDKLVFLKEKAFKDAEKKAKADSDKKLAEVEKVSADKDELIMELNSKIAASEEGSRAKDEEMANKDKEIERINNELEDTKRELEVTLKTFEEKNEPLKVEMAEMERKYILEIEENAKQFENEKKSMQEYIKKLTDDNERFRRTIKSIGNLIKK